MKTIFTHLFAALIMLAYAQNSKAQNQINLDIYHALGNSPFAFFQNTTSPSGETYKLDRLEYYLSEISITHDGGMVTAFDSVWILVNANDVTLESLGSAMIDSVESITFSVGVNQPYNHLDPSGWPGSHALYHKNPSMHWGWTAGYRFVALEGTGGSGQGQIFEVHALGNENYFETTTVVSAVADNGVVNVKIKGDYNEALRDVSVTSGVISHGATGESITVLENFRDYVFSESSETDTIPDTPEGVSDNFKQDLFKVLSNPATENIEVQCTADMTEGNLKLIDITGKVIIEKSVSANQKVLFSGLTSGVYIIIYSQNSGEILDTEKVIFQ